MWCLQCGAEYREGDTHCADCGTELTESPPDFPGARKRPASPESRRAGAQPVLVAGRALRCQVCGYDGFWRRKAELSTAGIGFFDLGGPNATVYVCDRCGFLHWFMPEMATGPEPIQCLDCGAVIPADRSECEECGWSYR